MKISNDIVLRPRFKMELSQSKETLLSAFLEAKVNERGFVVSTLDDHVFIRFPKQELQFWTPQLHLEINEMENGNSLLYGLFGPSPAVWTMFMFLHFLVASLFIAFGIWAYTNWSLGTPYILPLSLGILMMVIWVLLYFAGGIGKASGKKEMWQLKDFMDEVIK